MDEKELIELRRNENWKELKEKVIEKILKFEDKLKIKVNLKEIKDLLTQNNKNIILMPFKLEISIKNVWGHENIATGEPYSWKDMKIFLVPDKILSKIIIINPSFLRCLEGIEIDDTNEVKEGITIVEVAINE